MACAGVPRPVVRGCLGALGTPVSTEPRGRGMKRGAGREGVQAASGGETAAAGGPEGVSTILATIATAFPFAFAGALAGAEASAVGGTAGSGVSAAVGGAEEVAPGVSAYHWACQSAHSASLHSDPSEDQELPGPPLDPCHEPVLYRHARRSSLHPICACSLSASAMSDLTSEEL